MRASYERCRELNAQHGKTYYLATLLLPPAKRPYVHALYGFARYADEIVDDLASTLTEQEKADRLGSWGDAFFADLRRGRSDDPVCRAVVDTVQRWDIPVEHFEAFLHSMRMDLTVTEYATYDDLYEYVYGSAAVIGLQMVPILEPHRARGVRPREGPRRRLPARELRPRRRRGPRARSRLPPARGPRAVRRVPVPISSAGSSRPRCAPRCEFQIARVRRLEETSREGIALLHPSSQPCIEAARVLYCGIVDAVEDIDYQVFTTAPR